MVRQTTEKPIRIWPGAAIVLLQWVATFGSGKVAPGTPIQFFGLMGGPLVGALLLFLWWLFASRARWPDRLAGVALMVVGFVGAFKLSHESMPMAMIVWAIPVLCLAFVVWAWVTRGWADPSRRLAMVATILIACGVWTLLRLDGVRGGMEVDFSGRWATSPEDRLLATSKPAGAREGGLATEAEAAMLEPEWPGFRGASRDGIVRGVRIETDWTGSPPEVLWRRPVGPGWSSFAVWGDLLFTQEQRGEEEIVACYRASTGEPVWQHRDAARFWEAMGGPGPRATPTLHGGRVYAFGATGILNALNAADGSVVWSRNAAEESGAGVPEWGFASSPLIVDDLVIVHTGGPEGKSVVAFDLETGERRWLAPAGTLSYSSAHLTEIGGVRQVLLLTGDGATSLDPRTGSVLWTHEWSMGGGARIVQPAIVPEGNVLIGTGFGMGLRRIAASRQGETWNVEELWTTRALKPYFNDIVVHRGHAYGFDGRILSCVDLAGGERRWKGGRYGHGQLVLLAEQDLLLVLSEQGEVALVAADPSGFSELTRIAAIEGKTWNHPVLVDGVLYVRNSEEMAALRVPIEPARTAL